MPLTRFGLVQPKPGLGVIKIIKSRFLSFIIVLEIDFLLVVSLVLNAALTALFSFFVNLILSVEIFNFVSSFFATTLPFSLIYKVLPDVKIAWSNFNISDA